MLRPDGSLEGNPEWWVYAETVVGNMWLARWHGEPSARERAEATLEYIFNNLVDPSGEWYWSILPDGSPDRSQPKAGFWKCPYHNSRMCLELLRD
jgi:mannobiose 2-epimerase